MKKRTLSYHGFPKETHLLKNTLLVLCLIAFNMYPNYSRAQSGQTVRGTIQNESGELLENISVIQKGNSRNGVISGQGGAYQIVVPPGSVLIISSAEYVTQEINVGDRAIIDIKLSYKNKKMSEVVVVGYGSQSRRNITGSVTKVDMSATEKLPRTNITQALRGRVAGVQFTDNGRPGQNGTILIRGPKSLSGGNNPLIIVDGVFYNGTIASLNPNDIASIEILKDASAAAIYGSRAANGVLLITSKRGKSTQPTVSVSSYTGWSDWSYKPQLLTAERYVQRILDARKQSGLAADPGQAGQYLTSSEYENYKNGIVSDPWEIIAQKGKINSLDLSISGNPTAVNYFVSGSIQDEKGIVFNDNQKRISLRANIETKLNKNIQIGFNSNYSNRDLSGLAASPSSAATASPYGKWFYDDGAPTLFYVIEDTYQENAMRNAILTKNEEMYDNLFANFYAKVKLPFLEGLNYRINYAPNYRWEHEYDFMRQDLHSPTVNNREASKYNRTGFDWVLENILTYNKKLNLNNAIDITLLYGANKNRWEETTANSEKLPSDEIGWNNLGQGEVLTNSSNAASTQGVSSMARINYRFKDRYLVTLTARRDGSSVFGLNNKYATFPSAAFAWVASDEPFLKNVKSINSLKVRMSYGAVGNQAINPYQSLSLVGTTRYVFGDGSSYSLGAIPLNMANSNLKWETTYIGNLGLDFEILNGRLGGTFEIYKMRTQDLLIARTLPQATGFSTTLANLGKTSNRGIEISLNSVNIEKRHFQWSSNIVFSTNQNRIEGLYGIDADHDGKEDSDVGNKWFIGQPINVAYDYVFDGIYQKDGTGYKAGDVRLKDLNNDGLINAANDRTVLGQTAEPKYRWGVSNTLKYGSLSLSFFINAMQNWMRPVNYFRSALRSQNMFDWKWWTPENQSNSSPSLIYTNPYGINYYYSRSFIRLQDVSLSYDFDNSLLDRIGIKNLNVWISARNPFTLTDWPGMDPENGNSYDAYPMIKTISTGLSFNF